MNTLTLWAVGGIAALALLFGMYKTVDGRGFDRGVSETTAKWQDREAKQVAEYDEKRRALEDQYRDKEQRWVNLLANVDANYQKERSDAEIRRQADVAAARAGAIRLRDPARGSACPEAGGGQAGGAATGPSGGDGAQGAELSGEAAAFLLGLADEADEVVRQLTACQAVVSADRSAR